MTKISGIICILLGFWLFYLASEMYSNYMTASMLLWMSVTILSGLAMVAFTVGTFNKSYSSFSPEENKDIIDFDLEGKEQERPRPAGFIIVTGWLTLIASGLIIAGMVYALVFLGLGGWMGTKDTLMAGGMFLGSAGSIHYVIRKIMWKR